MKAILTMLALAGLASAQDMPRVELRVKSRGDTLNVRRSQLMEMAKDFQRNCPDVRIAVPQNRDAGKVDYIVVVNRVQTSLITQTYQMEVVNKDSNLVGADNKGKIRDGVSEFCDVILADWQKPQPPDEAAPAQQPPQDLQPGQEQATPEQAQAEPQTIQMGQTIDQVRSALGQPDKIVNLGVKQIYVYKDLKVTFVSEKVSDVQ